ncbi:MAG TPA: response regulator [Terriglobia bacterium]|nr:response regulator [Terriglobia bacterium]
MNLNEVEILLVEDNPSEVDLILHALRSNHVANSIHVARDGEEALDFLFCRGVYSHQTFSHPPKIILLDLGIPKMSGLEVLRVIRDDSRTRTVPVVMLTSSKADQDMMNSYQLGVNSYIQKPIDFNQFRETIRQLDFYWLILNELAPRA